MHRSIVDLTIPCLVASPQCQTPFRQAKTNYRKVPNHASEPCLQNPFLERTVMTITREQYEKSKKQVEKLAKHQATINAWETATKGFKPPEGRHVSKVDTETGEVSTKKNEETLKATG